MGNPGDMQSCTSPGSPRGGGVERDEVSARVMRQVTEAWRVLDGGDPRSAARVVTAGLTGVRLTDATSNAVAAVLADCAVALRGERVGDHSDAALREIERLLDEALQFSLHLSQWDSIGRMRASVRKARGAGRSTGSVPGRVWRRRGGGT